MKSLANGVRSSSHPYSENSRPGSGQSGKEQGLEDGRSAGDLGVEFHKVKAQLPSLSAKTKVFAVLRAPLQRFEDRRIKLLMSRHHVWLRCKPWVGRSAGILEKLEASAVKAAGTLVRKKPFLQCGSRPRAQYSDDVARFERSGARSRLGDYLVHGLG